MDRGHLEEECIGQVVGRAVILQWDQKWTLHMVDRFLKTRS